MMNITAADTLQWQVSELMLLFFVCFFYLWCGTFHSYRPERDFFFFFFFVFSSLIRSSLLSESNTRHGTSSNLLFLTSAGPWLLLFSGFRFFWAFFCFVSSSVGICLFTGELWFCLSLAFCCSFSSNACERHFCELPPSSSSPRYLWKTQPTTTS